MTLTFYFKVKYWSLKYFKSLYVIISQIMVQVTIDNKWEVMPWLSTGIFTFDLGAY